MLSFSMGIAAFVLYLLYDINSITRRYRIVNSFFLLGTLLLAAGAAMDVWESWRAGHFSGISDILLLAGSALSFAALIYCLFFALPFEKTYTDPTPGRHIYSGGVYALCRHPGILCFFATNLLLGLAALPDKMIGYRLLFCVLNLGYGWFQDRITFPKTFCDYSAYRNSVPFLIPTADSIRRAVKTLRPEDKEDEL